MVTNLSGFPPGLTVVAVPDGDVRKHREDFIVNENLKRMGCSGRAGLALSYPTGATQSKFHSLYKTSDRIPLYGAVLELVKLCQIALILFGVLAPEYADGLLCDMTETGINDWWTNIGIEHYDLEPSDGILGPTTVAALLGLLMGARNRLSAYGAQMSKDPFDITNMKRGIAHFQKSQKLPRTKRLDTGTIKRLREVTAKAASGQGWNIPKAVKSTVAELSGKGGDMMGMSGVRERAGFAEIETPDIEHFVEYLKGERAKWLWLGKPRKSTTQTYSELIPTSQHLVFDKDDRGGYVWLGRKPGSHDEEDVIGGISQRSTGSSSVYKGQTPDSATSLTSPIDREQNLRRNVFKSVTDRMSDARSGLGRVKDAVGLQGLRGNNSKIFKESTTELANEPSQGHSGTGKEAPTSVEVHDLAEMPRAQDPSRSSQELLSQADVSMSRRDVRQGDHSTSIPKPRASFSSSRSSLSILPTPSHRKDAHVRLSSDDDAEDNEEDDAHRLSFQDASLTDPSMDGSSYQLGLHTSLIQDRDSKTGGVGRLLRRSLSQSVIDQISGHHRDENWWPRHLSFGAAEDAVLVWDEVQDVSAKLDDLKQQNEVTTNARRMGELISRVNNQTRTWVERELKGVEDVNNSLGRDQEDIIVQYHQHLEDYETLCAGSSDLLSEERDHLMEAIKEIEVLGAKLEYELNALEAKVEDVEADVAEYEKNVQGIETKADEVAAEENAPETWFHWTVRMATGIGRPPIGPSI